MSDDDLTSEFDDVARRAWESYKIDHQADVRERLRVSTYETAQAVWPEALERVAAFLEASRREPYQPVEVALPLASLMSATLTTLLALRDRADADDAEVMLTLAALEIAYYAGRTEDNPLWRLHHGPPPASAQG